MRLKDGGSIRFQALLYCVTKYHKLDHSSENGYVDGIGIEILGVEIFNNSNKKSETFTTIEERIKLEDLKLKEEGIDTTKLVKFDGILYGKSFALIDYAGDLNKTIGKINYLIEKEYLPQLDGETNCKEILGASVLEANEKTLVLNINNVAVLFEAIDKLNLEKINTYILMNEFYNHSIKGEYKYLRILPENYSKEQSQRDNCFVIGAMVHNDNLYSEFMDKYKNKEDAFIRVVQSTVEGDIFIIDVLYETRNNKIHLVKDNTRDNFSAQEDRTIKYKTYEKTGVWNYAGSQYWVAYNGELPDGTYAEYTINSDDLFIIATIN